MELENIVHNIVGLSNKNNSNSQLSLHKDGIQGLDEKIDSGGKQSTPKGMEEDEC